MDKQHFTDNGQQKFPLSTEALDFIQKQIELGYKMTNLAGPNIIILEPTAAKEGLVIFDGELLPMAKIARGSYTRIAITETTESLSIEGFSGNVRTRRVAYYTNSGGSNEAKKLVSAFTSLKSISTLMEELDAAKQHIMPKGSIIDWYGECKAANVPYGFVPCGWFGKGLGSLQEIANEVEAWKAKYPNNITIVRTYTSGSRISISQCNGQVVPALTDKFIVQAGHSYSLGDTGGEATHKLTEAEMPKHAHKLLVCAHEYNATDTGGCDAGNNSSTRAWVIPHGTSCENAYTGGDESHENRPPYYALYKLIKVI